MESLLRDLSNIHAVSGREDAVAKIITRELRTKGEVKTDTLGNVIFHKKGSKPTIMLAAHMDEIGLMVRFIDEKGYLKFIPIGGIDNRTLPGQRVIIHGREGEVIGVIGVKPIHMLEDEERKKVQKAKDLFIDIGAKDRKDAEKRVSIGDVATYDSKFAKLNNTTFTGKAIDNRAGVAAMIRAVQLTKTKHEIYAVATVQEETGLKGARTSAFGIAPDIALAIDVGFAGDNPAVPEDQAPAKLGGGPILTVAEAGGRGLLSKKKVNDWLIKIAKSNSIPLHIQADDVGMTDSATIELSRSGVLTASIGIPTRYMHSANTVIDTKDIETTAKLIARAIESPLKI